MLFVKATKFSFFLLPTPFPEANNVSERANIVFVSQAVNELLHSDLIEEFFSAPCIVNPFSVSI